MFAARRMVRLPMQLLWLLMLTGVSVSFADDSSWRTLEPGLEFGRFEAPYGQTQEVGVFHVLRIDPAHFDLRLINASATDERRALTARGWSEQEGLVAAINASMFQADYLSSVSLMRTQGHVNNPRVSRDKTILAFDPKDDSLPPVKLIDRECDNFDDWKDRYRSFVQSIRMISCKGENVWGEQARRWSTAAMATDSQGRFLMIHVRVPYSMHTLIEHLKALPLDIERAMYAEGGVQAQMYVSSGEFSEEFVGTFGGGYPTAETGPAWPIPNVIGIVRRPD